MKTKEFVRQVEALGYEVSYSWGTIYIKRAGFAILDLGYEEEWDIDTDYPGFDEMRWDDKKELMTIVSEYMLTDPKEREEEKRYWLQKIPIPLLDNGTEKKWLWKYTGTAPSNMFGVDTTKIDRELYKTIFTESEIAQMDITGFVKVEVTEC